MISSRTQSHTHTGKDKLTKQEITEELANIRTRLTTQFQTEPQKLEAFLSTLEELTKFELGRFLIKNKGALSGYWTWYVILGFNQHTITSPLEKFILEKAPAILATQERFTIFQSLLKKHITSNSMVCSVPCGMMADLLTLDIPDQIQEVRFVGIDLDGTVFDLAKSLQQETRNRFSAKFFVQNAWRLDQASQYDVITSNGLNIYEPDDDKVVLLYRSFYQALKINGKLICSALTPPPGITDKSEWNLAEIDKHDINEQITLFKIILEATWANFRTSEKTCSQLKKAGFDEIEIHWDKRKMFPSFCATKGMN